jgi:hypothetical protein
MKTKSTRLIEINFNSNEKEKIAEWIMNHSVEISKNFTLNKPVLEEFKDG